MSIADRLKRLIEEEGSQVNFAKKTGINRPSLSKAINSDSGLRTGTVELIAKAYPNLNLNWLLMGRGAMWIDADNPDPEAIPGSEMSEDPDAEVWGKLNRLLEHRVRELEREIKEENPELAKKLGIE